MRQLRAELASPQKYLASSRKVMNRSQDKVLQHINRVQAYPNYRAGRAGSQSIRNQSLQPFGAGDEAPKFARNDQQMSLRLQTRSNVDIRSRSQLAYGYPLSDSLLKE